MPLVVLLLLIFYGVIPVNFLLIEEPKTRNANSQIVHTTRFGELQSGRRGSDSKGDQPTLGNGGKRLICECFHLDAPFNIHFPSPNNNKRSRNTFKCSQRETSLNFKPHGKLSLQLIMIIKSMISTWLLPYRWERHFFTLFSSLHPDFAHFCNWFLNIEALALR